MDYAGSFTAFSHGVFRFHEFVVWFSSGKLMLPTVLFVAVTLWTLSLASNLVAAGPDFTQCRIEAATESVPAGQIVKFQMILKNSGDEDSEGTDLRINLPQAGFLVRIDDLPDLKHLVEDREVTAYLNLKAGEEFRFTFDILASRSASGSVLNADVEFRNFLKEVEWFSQASVDITSEQSKAGWMVGKVRVHPAALWLLGWILAGWLLFFWIRMRLRQISQHPLSSRMAGEVRRWPAFGITAIVMASSAFLLVFAGLAWRDFKTITKWKEAPATILDRREVVTTSTGRSRKVNGRTERETSTTRSPEFAFRFMADGNEIITSGYETGTSVHIGGQVSNKAEMDTWLPGKTITCWYDPENPANAIVRRGFGGVYFFAILPLPIFFFGMSRIRRINLTLRRMNDAASEQSGGLLP